MTQEYEYENANDNTVVVDDSTNNYIEAIKELKANTVSKDDYLKLKQENKQLFETLVSGGQIVDKNKEQENYNLDEIREHLFANNGEDVVNDLDFFENVMKLRDGIMKEGGRDPFLPVGRDYATVSDSDIEIAERCANVYKDCIDQANGDNGIFVALLNSKTVDAPGFFPGKRRK